MLTKSEYKLSKSCLKKLVYHKEGYPTVKDVDAFKSFLGEKGGLSVVMAKAIRTGSLKLGQDTRVEQRLIVVQRAVDHCKTKVQKVNEKVFYVVLRLLFFLTVVFSVLYFILMYFIS